MGYLDMRTSIERAAYAAHLETCMQRVEVILAEAREICGMYSRGDGSPLDKAVARLGIELALYESGN